MQEVACRTRKTEETLSNSFFNPTSAYVLVENCTCYEYAYLNTLACTPPLFEQTHLRHEEWGGIRISRIFRYWKLETRTRWTNLWISMCIYIQECRVVKVALLNFLLFVVGEDSEFGEYRLRDRSGSIIGGIGSRSLRVSRAFHVPVKSLLSISL